MGSGLLTQGPHWINAVALPPAFANLFHLWYNKTALFALIRLLFIGADDGPPESKVQSRTKKAARGLRVRRARQVSRSCVPTGCAPSPDVYNALLTPAC